MTKGTAQPDSDLDIALALNPELGDPDSFTTWMFKREQWVADLRVLLAFNKVHLEWFGGKHTPTIKAGIEEAKIAVYVDPELAGDESCPSS